MLGLGWCQWYVNPDSVDRAQASADAQRTFWHYNQLTYYIIIYRRLYGSNNHLQSILIFLLHPGFATAVFGGASMGLVAMLPGEYTTAVMSGQGVAGIIAGGIQIALLIAMPVPTDPTEAQEGKSTRRNIDINTPCHGFSYESPHY